MSRPDDVNRGSSDGAPRVSGDEPKQATKATRLLQCSPRERG